MIIWLNNPFDNLEEEGARPQRYAMLSRELAKRGHCVVWWTSAFSHVHKAYRIDHDNKPIARDYVNAHGVRTILVDAPQYASNLSLRRIANHRAYASNWAKQAKAAVAKKTLSKPDIIVTSLPPLSVHAAAVELRTAFECKLLVDIQDAWPEALFGVLPKALSYVAKVSLGPILSTMARHAYCHADGITAVSESYLTLARKYGAKCPMQAFRLGIDKPAEIPISHASSRDNTVPNPLRIVYGGNMGRSYDLDTLIRAVMSVVKHSPDSVTLDIAGTGPDEARLRKLASDCSAIHFHGFLMKDKYEVLLSRADIGAIPMRNGSFGAFPNKVADYAASGLAVLCSLSGEARITLEKYGSGLWYREGDVEALSALIVDLSGNISKVDKMKAMSCTMLENEFCASAIYPKMCKFIEGFQKS